MKTLTFIAFMFISIMNMAAQGGAKEQSEGEKKVEVKTKYEIFLSDYGVADETEVRGLTDKVGEEQGKKRNLLTGLLGIYSPGLISKTTTATTNVINLFIESMKGQRKNWLQAAQQQCTFTKSLAQQTKKDDFYCLPSTKGALDPSNIKFKGFGCRNYVECVNDSTSGREVFRVFCKLRTDTEGISSIVNHSKFLVELDTLMFDPFYCDLPYDTITKGRIMPFDFAKRKDLTFKLNVKLYSSWINEAIMVTTDQLLGEFNVTARINKENLNGDSIFVYSGAKDSLLLKEGIVSVTGDCFLVPRSFTGTPDGTTAGRAWGTGEYRVEMTVTETCQMDESFYRKKQEDGKEGDWKKDEWGPEWETIKKERKTADLLKNIGSTVVSTFKGSNGWVEVFTEPAITTISTSETTLLNKFLHVETTETSVAM